MEVACLSETCLASASGTVSVPGAAKVFKLRRAGARVPKCGRAKLRLKIPRKAQRAIKRALRRRKKVKAVVTVTVRDRFGNAASQKRTIRLKR